MDKRTRALMNVQLLSLFGFNKLRYGKGKHRVLKMIGYTLLAVYLLAVFVGYTGGYAYLLGKAGVPELALPAMITALSLLVFFTMLFRAGSSIYGGRDYDAVMSMPVPVSGIVASRIIPLYLASLLYSFILLLPSGVVYTFFVPVGAAYWITLVLLVFLTPVVPLSLGLLIGALIAYIAVRFKKKNMVSSVLSLVLFIVIMSVSMNASNLSETRVKEMSIALLARMNRIYSLLPLYTKALIGGSFLSLLLALLLSAAAAALCIYWIGRRFKSINSRLQAKQAGKAYRIRDIKTNSAFGALFRKEVRRLLSSSAYLMNTAVGMLMMIFFAVMIALRLGGLDLSTAGASDAAAADKVFAFLPLFFALFASMINVTASSLSLEGKNLWILTSAPLTPKTIYASKIAVDYAVMLPGVIISGAIIDIAQKPPFLLGLFQFLLPLSFGMFAGVFGMLLNVRFPNYEWTQDVQVVKRGIGPMVTILGDMALVGICFIPAIFLPSRFLVLFYTILTLSMFTVTWIIWVETAKMPIKKGN